MINGAVHPIIVSMCLCRALVCRGTPHLQDAMATPAFKQSFARYPDVLVKDALEKTVIKVIDLNHQNQDIGEINWAKELMAEGIQVSYLSNPCQLIETSGQTPKISQIEVRHCFTPWMWNKVLGNTIAGGICISHLRALHECVAQNPDANTIIIMEGDVTEHQNTHQLMSAFLANWHGNEALKNTKYCALTFSDWHSGYSQIVRGEGKTVPGSIVAPYFKMISLPMQKWNQHEWKFQFVGQGARAIAYTRAFVDEILEVKVGNYWDMHLLDLLSKQSNDEWKKHQKWHCPLKATVCDPPVFEHIPSFDKRFRGSGRLEAAAVSPAEETSYYMTVSLNHEWGLVNRLQTLALLTGIGGLYRIGLYVLWEPKKACWSTFAETNVLDESSEVFEAVPFIKIYDDPKDQNWKAAKNNQHWHVAHFESQCQVEMGIQYFFEILEAQARKERDTYLLEATLPNLRRKLTPDYCWQLINVTDLIYKKAYDYVRGGDDATAKQVAIHCRRGDHKYMNCDAHLEKQSPEAFAIQCQWEEGDGKMQDLIVRSKVFFLIWEGCSHLELRCLS